MGKEECRHTMLEKPPIKYDAASICPHHPSAYGNGEYTVESMSVCTENPELYRVHWEKWEGFDTIEPIGKNKMIKLF